MGAAILSQGCTTITEKVSKNQNIKVTMVATAPLAAPANNITIVERPGKEDIVYASNDRSLLGIVAPAAIGAAGGVIASSQVRCSSNCGDFYVASGSTALSTSDNTIRINR